MAMSARTPTTGCATMRAPTRRSGRTWRFGLAACLSFPDCCLRCLAAANAEDVVVALLSTCCLWDHHERGWPSERNSLAKEFLTDDRISIVAISAHHRQQGCAKTHLGPAARSCCQAGIDATSFATYWPERASIARDSLLVVQTWSQRVRRRRRRSRTRAWRTWRTCGSSCTRRCAAPSRRPTRLPRCGARALLAWLHFMLWCCRCRGCAGGVSY